MSKNLRFLVPATLALLACAAPASADTVADFYRGQTLNIIVGSDPGGGYDAWGRVVARHIGKHLPGTPNVVPQNMPGGGSFNAANNIYSIAPKDGTVFGNRERLLPLKERGWYREYTVRTPGSRDRGARRIVKLKG